MIWIIGIFFPRQLNTINIKQPKLDHSLETAAEKEARNIEYQKYIFVNRYQKTLHFLQLLACKSS